MTPLHTSNRRYDHREDWLGEQEDPSIPGTESLSWRNIGQMRFTEHSSPVLSAPSGILTPSSMFGSFLGGVGAADVEPSSFLTGVFAADAEPSFLSWPTSLALSCNRGTLTRGWLSSSSSEEMTRTCPWGAGGPLAGTSFVAGPRKLTCACLTLATCSATSCPTSVCSSGRRSLKPFRPWGPLASKESWNSQALSFTCKVGLG